MQHLPVRDGNGTSSLRLFESNRFWGGAALGGLIGAMAAGPHLNQWSFLASMGTILGCAAAVGLSGYWILALFAGPIAGGAGYRDDDELDDSDDDGVVGGLSMDD